MKLRNIFIAILASSSWYGQADHELVHQISCEVSYSVGPHRTLENAFETNDFLAEPSSNIKIVDKTDPTRFSFYLPAEESAEVDWQTVPLHPVDKDRQDMAFSFSAKIEEGSGEVFLNFGGIDEPQQPTDLFFSVHSLKGDYKSSSFYRVIDWNKDGYEKIFIDCQTWAGALRDLDWLMDQLADWLKKLEKLENRKTSTSLFDFVDLDHI